MHLTHNDRQTTLSTYISKWQSVCHVLVTTLGDRQATQSTYIGIKFFLFPWQSIYAICHILPLVTCKPHVYKTHIGTELILFPWQSECHIFVTHTTLGERHASEYSHWHRTRLVLLIGPPPAGPCWLLARWTDQCACCGFPAAHAPWPRMSTGRKKGETRNVRCRATQMYPPDHCEFSYIQYNPLYKIKKCGLQTSRQRPTKILPLTL